MPFESFVAAAIQMVSGSDVSENLAAAAGRYAYHRLIAMILSGSQKISNHVQFAFGPLVAT